MKLTEIQAKAKAKLPVNKQEAGSEALENVNLFTEFRDILSLKRQEKRAYEHKMRKLLIEKKLYYSGKADPDVYKDKPFNLRLKAAEVEEYVKADPEVFSLDAKLFEVEESISYLEDTMRAIKDRGFAIKNYIEWQKFMFGG